MSIRRLGLILIIASVLLSLVAGTALAGAGQGQKHKWSEQFQDMQGFEWGSSQVAKMAASGVFKGQAERLFAPGAKISHQEAAVALVRFLEKETESQALTQAEIDNLLKDIPDRSKIAPWAIAAVAELVKLEVIDPKAPFDPTGHATRLEIAVWLVKALGEDAEAQASMTKALEFRDASLIPANMVGYVYVAVDLQLIVGYGDRTFRPHQGVKRVEAAVMFGRAALVDWKSHNEVHGTIKAINTTDKSLTITKSDGLDATYVLTEDAAIFIGEDEKTLADLVVGMTVVVKLNGEGKARYVEATPAAPPASTTVTGTISALVIPPASALAQVTVAGATYNIAATATVTLNSAASTVAALQTGDTVTLTIVSGTVTVIAATRTP